jgi:hypothetical protein
MHEDEWGKQILEKLMIDRFTLGDDFAYDSIREMRSWVKAKYEK